MARRHASPARSYFFLSARNLCVLLVSLPLPRRARVAGVGRQSRRKLERGLRLAGDRPLGARRAMARYLFLLGAPTPGQSKDRRAVDVGGARTPARAPSSHAKVGRSRRHLEEVSVNQRWYRHLEGQPGRRPSPLVGALPSDQRRRKATPEFARSSPHCRARRALSGADWRLRSKRLLRAGAREAPGHRSANADPFATSPRRRAGQPRPTGMTPTFWRISARRCSPRSALPDQAHRS